MIIYIVKKYDKHIDDVLDGFYYLDDANEAARKFAKKHKFETKERDGFIHGESESESYSVEVCEVELI